MEVININERSASRRKADILELLDFIREEVEAGNVEEIVAVTLDSDGECEAHAVIKDLAGGIGMFEIGKHIIISTEG